MYRTIEVWNDANGNKQRTKKKRFKHTLGNARNGMRDRERKKR